MNREPRRQRTYFILLLVTAFALLTIDYHSDGASSPLHPLEKAVAGIVGPGEKAVASLVKPLTDQVHFGKQPDKVAELQKQLDAATSLAETAQNDHRLVAQLDKLMGWDPYYVDKMLPARVVATGDTLSNTQSVTIAAGTRRGVHINMTVVTGLGLIGNVVQVSAETSTVELLTDPGISVGVRNSRTNTAGIVQGGKNGTLDLTQYNQTSDIRKGDYLVTRGSDNNTPYVPDVPVGKVIAVDNTPGSATHTAVVQPFASFDGLDLVAIIFPPPGKFPHQFFIAPVTPGPTTTAPVITTTSATPPASINPLAPASGAPTSGTSGTPTTGTTSRSAVTTTPPPPTHTSAVATTTTPAVKTTTPKPATHTSTKPPVTKTTPPKSVTPTHTTTPPPKPTTTPPPPGAPTS
ncbi:hypothetical protein acdb102_34270 [Acidothermaceae bacterium B102]|nr:hypothetical protein acdb102_34270 [Acidothermaceae bacterium B102]